MKGSSYEVSECFYEAILYGSLKIQNFFKLFLLLGTKDHLKCQKP